MTNALVLLHRHVPRDGLLKFQRSRLSNRHPLAGSVNAYQAKDRSPATAKQGLEIRSLYPWRNGHVPVSPVPKTSFRRKHNPTWSKQYLSRVCIFNVLQHDYCFSIYLGIRDQHVAGSFFVFVYLLTTLRWHRLLAPHYTRSCASECLATS